MLIQSMKDVTNPINILGYWNTIQSEQQPYLSDMFLQNTPINQSTVNIFKGSNRPVDGMQLSPNNAKVDPEGNGGFESYPVNLMQFRSLRVMDEDRQEQLEDLLAANANNSQFIDALTKNEFNDAAKQITSANKQVEIMFTQALQTGKIDVHDSKNRRVEDFKMPSVNHQGVKTEWGNSDAQPLTNLYDAVQFMNDHYSISEGLAIMNTHTFNKMLESGEIKNTLLPNSNNGNLTIDPQQGRNLVSERTGLNIKLYDKTSRDENNIDQPMIPDGRVILAPANQIGRRAWKPTSESRMLSGQSDVQIANTGTGITLATYNGINPTGRFSLASQKVLPVIDTIESIMNLDVYTPAGSTDGTKSSITTSINDSSNSNQSSGSTSSTNSKSSTQSSKS